MSPFHRLQPIMATSNGPSAFCRIFPWYGWRRRFLWDGEFSTLQPNPVCLCSPRPAACLVALCLLPLAFFFCTCMRFEAEFLPVLIWLAALGVLGIERWLATVKNGWTANQGYRVAIRSAWGFLVVFSVAFNVLICFQNYADADCHQGNARLDAGHYDEALRLYRRALQFMPGLCGTAPLPWIRLRSEGKKSGSDAGIPESDSMQSGHARNP